VQMTTISDDGSRPEILITSTFRLQLIHSLCS